MQDLDLQNSKSSREKKLNVELSKFLLKRKGNVCGRGGPGSPDGLHHHRNRHPSYRLGSWPVVEKRNPGIVSVRCKALETQVEGLLIDCIEAVSNEMVKTWEMFL